MLVSKLCDFYLEKPYIRWFVFAAGEMWIGVCLTCVLELVPERIRAASIGYYLFIITNIGGNIPLLVPPLKTAFAKASTELALRSK